jgi:hypothetical protein
MATSQRIPSSKLEHLVTQAPHDADNYHFSNFAWLEACINAPLRVDSQALDFLRIA